MIAGIFFKKKKKSFFFPGNNYKANENMYKNVQVVVVT